MSHCISLLGVAGKTAYHGLLNVPGIHAGETLLVSAAAGSVGSIVGQIGKIKGATVIGIAGGADKCRWVEQDLGFDHCLDYKDTSQPLRKSLADAAWDIHIQLTLRYTKCIKPTFRHTKRIELTFRHTKTH